MNKYRAGGPSRATATTLCQKCLKRGHYTYECTAAQQERPYISRPSRSQQLSNPKLAPKLSATLPPAETETKPAAKPDAEKSLSKLDARPEPPSDTKRLGRGNIDSPERKRRRSISSQSSDSFATISTSRSLSKSRSPPSRRDSERYDRSQGRERRHNRRQSFSDNRTKSYTEDYSRDYYVQRRYSPSSHRSRPKPPLRRARSRSRSAPRRDLNRGLGRRSRSRSPYRDQASSNTRPPALAALPRQARGRSLSLDS